MASTMAWAHKIFDGQWRTGGGGTLDVVAPATAEVIATVGAADVGDLDRAVAKAVSAQ